MISKQLRNIKIGREFDSANYKLGVIFPFRYSEDRLDAIGRIKEVFSINRNKEVKFYLVDSGSPTKISKEIEEICNEHNVNYIYIDSRHELFSAGKARDIGAMYANVQYLFFQDIDLLPYDGFYEELLKEIKVNDLDTKNEDFIMIPCVYLTEEGSTQYMECDGETRKSKFIQYVYEGNKDIYINYAVGSSAILVNRMHYLSVGGHDEEFFGHGFEDFELIHRLAAINQKFYRPFKYYTDLKKWDPIEYLGFRSYFRLYGDLAAIKGMYLFHIWHAPSQNRTNYTAKNQENKQLLVEKMKVFDKTHKNPTPLPNIYSDQTLALGNEGNAFYKSIWQVFPHFGVVTFKAENEFKDEKEFLAYYNKRAFSRVIMPNPYGNEHRLSMYKVCKEMNIPIVISDRGALNDSVFFDEHGFNADSKSYSEEKWNRPLTLEEENETLSYIQQQYKEDSALESQGNRIGADNLARKLGIKNGKVLFVPFQRPSDTVIKYFSGAVANMDEFVEFLESLSKILDDDWTIIAKKHPLETVRPVGGIRFVDDDTHIKDLIELADAVLLINSGVGLQSMLWYKPVLYVGEAFYGFNGINKKVNSPKQAKKVLENLFKVDEEKVHRFIYYLIKDFYSFGHTKSEVVKRADGSMFNVTREISFYQINVPGAHVRKYVRRGKPDVPFSATILDRYRAYFNRTANEKKNPKVSTGKVTKNAPQKLNKKKEGSFKWAIRQSIKLVTKPKLFLFHFKRWNVNRKK